MASYAWLLPLVKTVCPFLRATQAANYTWLVVALLTQRTLCLTALARPSRARPRAARRLRSTSCSIGSSASRAS